MVSVRYDAVRRYLTVEGVSGDIRARVERLEVTAELVNDVAVIVLRRDGRFGGSSENRRGSGGKRHDAALK